MHVFEFTRGMCSATPKTLIITYIDTKREQTLFLRLQNMCIQLWTRHTVILHYNVNMCISLSLYRSIALALSNTLTSHVFSIASQKSKHHRNGSQHAYHRLVALMQSQSQSQLHSHSSRPNESIIKNERRTQTQSVEVHKCTCFCLSTALVWNEHFL